MCCGRGKPRRTRVGRSGKIKRSQNLQALSNDNIDNRERLQPPSDEQSEDLKRIVDSPEIQRP